MKYIVFSAFILGIIACKQKYLSYKEALINCEENKVTLPMENESLGIKTSVDRFSESCIEGYLLPDFELKSIDGAIITADSLKGKLSIINFWFQTCAPCIAEMPGLNHLKEKYGTASINYMAISTDSEKDVREFLTRKAFNFTHISNGEAIYRDTFKSKWGFPFTIITSQDNTILKAFGGGATDSTAVQKIINQIEPVLLQEKVKPL